MARTMNRPLANNRLPVYCAIIWAGLCLTLSGLIFLLHILTDMTRRPAGAAEQAEAGTEDVGP